jgi:hypothetical protein
MKDMAAPTKRDPEIAFPRVTGSRLWKRAVSTEMSSVLIKPAGRRNMLATEGSNPMLTKVDTASQMDKYLPTISLACMLRYTARSTNQPVAEHGLDHERAQLVACLVLPTHRGGKLPRTSLQHSCILLAGEGKPSASDK